MIDSSYHLTTQTISQGQSLRLPPPRSRVLALPAPAPQIAGFLADGLPVIEMNASIPPLYALPDVGAYLKQKTGFRNLEEINAHFDAKMEEIERRGYERLM